jgi:hypothetical protein
MPIRAISRFAAAAWLLGSVAIVQAADSPAGDAAIRAKAGPGEIVITTTSRVAGAIHSLTWNGMEFIDSADHGRQLQSASNLDCGRQPYFAETFNPTEAGSLSDGAGPASTSRLLKHRAQANVLETTTQMAFWLRPGERSMGHPALNDKPLSDHLLTKRVRIGHKHLPHVVQYDVTFTIPRGERHTWAQFEGVTGYMPPQFARFWKYNAAAQELEALSDGPGEQAMPVVLATETGSHAMGVYSPDQPSKGYETAGYGRWRFQEERVVKWNCVFRLRDEAGIKPGDYSFRQFVIVGSLDDVRRSLRSLHEEFGKTDR